MMNLIIIFLFFRFSMAMDPVKKLTCSLPTFKKLVVDRTTLNEYSIKEYSKLFPDKVKKPAIYMYPAGLRGYYNLGVACYLKQNYNLDDYIICGASAGAWNSLVMAYKGNSMNFCTKILRNIKEECKASTIYDQQLFLQNYFINNYNISDFYFNNTYLSVCIKENEKTQFSTHLYTNFKTMKDITNCCLASSNIPLITGPKSLYYDGFYAIDGGFNPRPFFDKIKPTLEIRYDMWNRKEKEIPPTTMFYALQDLDIEKSFFMGVNDCYANEIKIDKLFHKGDNL